MSDSRKNHRTVVVDPYHPRQDIFRNREENFNRIRYGFAREILPLPGGENAHLLDVGGGAAEFSRIAKHIGYQVTFIDGNASNVKRASTLGFESYEVDLNREWQLFAPETFDGAVLLDVIEHIVAANVVLREIAQVLKEDGFLVVTTPNIAFWRRRLSALWGNPPPSEGYHFRFFTRQSLESILIDSGFRVETTASTTRIPLLNRIRGWFGKEPTYVKSTRLEPFFAKDLALLARKRAKPEPESGGVNNKVGE